MTKRLLLAAMLAVAIPAHAQKAPAAPASAAATAPSSPAKKALVAKVLQLQQPGIESLARQLAAQPAAALAQQATAVLQRVPEDKRQALARELDADMRKYIDETSPQVRDRAVKLAPTTIGPLLEQRFSEEELKQLVAMLESPVYKRYQGMTGDMLRALGEKLGTEIRPIIEPKARALEQSMRKRFEAAAPAAAASGANGGNGAKK